MVAPAAGSDGSRVFSCRGWEPGGDARASQSVSQLYSVIILLITVLLLSHHQIRSDHDQTGVRSQNVPKVLHSLLAASPGQPEFAPSAPLAVVLPQHQLGRGGVAPAGQEVQGAK